MAFFESLISFLTILKESIKILPKNGKLMALIAISSMLISSCSFFLINYSLQSLITDMSVTIMQSIMPDPTADSSTAFDPTKTFALFDNLRHNLALIFAVEIVAGLVFAIISFFFAISTIIVSAYSYKDTTLSIRELFSVLQKTWTRPLITTFYVTGLAMGYFIVVLALTFPLIMLYPNMTAISVAVVIWIAACFLYFYVVVEWILAIVVSAIEESCYGIQAMKRASTLVKGKRFHGFLLILCSNVVGGIIFQGFTMIFGNKVLVMHPTVYGLFVTNISSLLRIVFLVAYTVLYFHCKKPHGEETGLHGSLEYTKLPTALLANDV